jgi:hypothetical protein
MANIEELRKNVITRILDGDGTTSNAQRRSAFDDAALTEPLCTLVRKIARQAHKVTSDDIAAMRASGFSEDQIFEIVICAAVGQAARQYDGALAALDAATARSGHAPLDSR